MSTISDILHEDVEELSAVYISRGLRIKKFDAGKTCIKSGALFVYDVNKFEIVLRKWEPLVIEKGWLPEVDYIVRQIAEMWFDPGDPILNFIKELYAD